MRIFLNPAIRRTRATHKPKPKKAQPIKLIKRSVACEIKPELDVKAILMPRIKRIKSKLDALHALFNSEIATEEKQDD